MRFVWVARMGSSLPPESTAGSVQAISMPGVSAWVKRESFGGSELAEKVS